MLLVKRIPWPNIWGILELNLVEPLCIIMFRDAPTDDNAGTAKIFLNLVFDHFSYKGQRIFIFWKQSGSCFDRNKKNKTAHDSSWGTLAQSWKRSGLRHKNWIIIPCPFLHINKAKDWEVCNILVLKTHISCTFLK